MPHLTIRALSGADELDVYNQLAYSLEGEYETDLLEGRRQPGWLWLALRGDRLIARAGWWGFAGSERPLLMDVLDLDAAAPDGVEVAVRLVRTALKELGMLAAPPELGRFTSADWRNDPVEAAAVAVREAVVRRLGGRLLAERLRLAWGPGGAVPADRGRLHMRPFTGREETLDLLTRTLQASLDAHSRAQLRTCSPLEVATDQLDHEFPRYRGPREWWAVGCRADGEPVGFVIPSRNDYHPIVAYLGVLPEHRGHGYADALLDHATRLLAAAGAREIHASTDVTNTPMAAAFHRCGYPSTGGELDYSFSSGA